MSGLEALGAAAAIAQFLEYGFKLTQKAIEVYRHDATQSTKEVETSVDEFRAQNEMMLARYQGNRQLSEVERRVQETAHKCDQIASDLLRDLQGLKAHGQKSLLKSLGIAFKDDWREKGKSKIQRHERRLEEARRQLNEQILRLLSEQQSGVKKALLRIEQRNDDIGANLSSRMTSLEAALRQAIKTGGSVSIQQQLRDLESEGKSVLIRQEILSSLRYEDQDKRLKDGIVEAGMDTYEWIFEDVDAADPPTPASGDDKEPEDTMPPVNFMRWLVRSNGIFWIEGKPGCGKSTLMKHISHHSRTADALNNWAQGRRLVLASHYFWISGGPMQRSYEGLLRSILWDVLRQCPEIIEDVCSARSGDDAVGRDARAMPWTQADLKGCVDTLASGKLSGTGNADCFCFFIDGLDEYEGSFEDHQDMTKLLRNMAEAPNVKICTSSREWEVFKTGFSESNALGNHLLLHLYTRNDIANVVNQLLEGAMRHRIRDDHDQIERLVNDVIEKAEGVFLWVRLVIRELLQGFEHEDDVMALRDRLRVIPSDLEDYFERMFNKIPKFYHTKGARVFKACLTANESLPMNIATFLESDQPELDALNMPQDRSYDWFDHSLAVLTRKQVNGWCQDMLTVDSPSETEYDTQGRRSRDRLYRINFIHRTVRDWLHDKKINDLDARAGQSFDPFRTLFAAYVSLIKRSFSLGKKSKPRLATNWSTYALLHASRVTDTVSARRLLRDLDATMEAVFEPELSHRGLQGKHWSNLVAQRDSGSSRVQTRGMVPEKGDRDLLGHVIELGVFWYVEGECKSHPSVLSGKAGKGRPYLDYALRHEPNARYQVPGLLALRSSLPNSFPDPRMVQLLLDANCNINEKVWTQDGRSIWDLFLAWMHDTMLDSQASRLVTWLLIEHGAQNVHQVKTSTTTKDSTAKYRNKVTDAKIYSMRTILTDRFGEEEANKMCERVAQNSKGWFSSWW